MAKVAFIGLGVMGFPMAGHLAAKGHEVTVFNRTRAKAESWVAKHGGKRADTPAKAVAGAEFVFSCVGDDPDCADPELDTIVTLWYATAWSRRVFATTPAMR
ncbi:MAG: NAD(P)-dependent oxidoreductase, partial [Gammaproteobacteria bacterium]|nr:NAD(P)-dependent oxidoreductase [Gammaproteobacteria bacterium]